MKQSQTGVAAKEGAGKLKLAPSSLSPWKSTAPMAKWKKPQPLDFVEAASKTYQTSPTGNRATTIPSFF